MSLNPFGNNYNWNYSNPNKDGYSETLIGTVLAIQEVQGRKWTPNGPSIPETWDDGKPKFKLRMSLATPDRQLKTITFSPAGKAQQQGHKKSLHMDLFALTGNTDMSHLIGKTIQLSTHPFAPEFLNIKNQGWGQGNPREFDVQIVDGGPYELDYPLPERYTTQRQLQDDFVSGGQIQQSYQQQYQQPQPMNPAYIQNPQPMQYQQPQYPIAQPTMPVQSVPQQYQQHVMQQQPVQQVQAMQPAMPVGMDPQIAAQMQAMGVTNVQQVEPYDDENVPF